MKEIEGDKKTPTFSWLSMNCDGNDSNLKSLGGVFPFLDSPLPPQMQIPSSLPVLHPTPQVITNPFRHLMLFYF